MPGKISSPTVHDAIIETSKRLQPRKIVCDEDRNLGRFEAELLLSHILAQNRTWLRVHDQEHLSPRHYRQLISCVERRERHEPVAYILGKKEFFNHTFHVTRDTLIPRPESELLVELALGAVDHLQRDRAASLSSRPLIWDLGTGSGAIGISLALALPRSSIIASDISRAALHVARKNARLLKAANITFVHADLCDKKMARRFGSPSKIPIIIANLPYLPDRDRLHLDADVADYEPASALFAGKDGLDCIRRFLDQLTTLSYASVFLEYDPPQTDMLRAIATAHVPDAIIRIHRDLAGRDRVLEITRRAIP